jgi:hypothetical protein
VLPPALCPAGSHVYLPYQFLQPHQDLKIRIPKETKPRTNKQSSLTRRKNKPSVQTREKWNSPPSFIANSVLQLSILSTRFRTGRSPTGTVQMLRNEVPEEKYIISVLRYMHPDIFFSNCCRLSSNGAG